MKYNIKKIMIIFAMGATLTSCNDFLTTDPESSYSADGSYKTQTDFTYAIAGAYAAQQDIYSSNQSLLRDLTGRSDEAKYGGMYFYGIDQFTDTAENGELTTRWTCFWQIIDRCNFILDKIDGGTFTDSNAKNYIKGEAYGLRAWSYYMLGCLFGGMPLIDKVLTADETKAIARSTQEETFAFAEKDFKSAIELLPTSWSGSNAGRVTKYAAEGVLARMYMFQSKFALAKPYLQDIISSGLYGMEENYLNCFTDSHDNGKERVWEVQFSGGLKGEGQMFSTGCIPEGYADKVIIPFSGYSTALTVSLDMFGSYENGDLRRDISTVSNLKVNGVVESKYAYISKYCHYDSYKPQSQNDWPINIPILRYTDVLMMYAECLNEEGYAANGESIHDTRPWNITHEGDIWFAKSKDNKCVYAFVTNTDWKYGERKEFIIKSMKGSYKTKVSILGYDSKLVEYRENFDASIRMDASPLGLVISAVNGQRFYTNNLWDNPVVFKIENVEYNPSSNNETKSSEIDGAL